MGSVSSKEIPDHIGVYQLTEKIAEGGFGVVYRAFDPRLKRDVAVKILHPQHSTEPTRVARFLREAQSAARISHPNIVQIYDIVEENGKLALVMEFVSGESLDKFIKNNPHLSLTERLQIAIQIAEALNVAHEFGIIHRDIKPANILIDKNLNVKLTDFNLARLLDNSLTPLTGDHNVLGTPAYMSPEQCQGKEATPLSDIYSFGVVMYFLFTGTLPFEGNNYLALMRHHLETPPTPVRIINPNLPISLEKLITQCLAKSPENRPASANDIADLLKKILEEILQKTTPVESTDQPTIVLKESTPPHPIESGLASSERTPAHSTYPITPPTATVQAPSHPSSPNQSIPTTTPPQTPSPMVADKLGEPTYTSAQPPQTPYQTLYISASPIQPYPPHQQPQLTTSQQFGVNTKDLINSRLGVIIVILLALTLISTSISIFLAYKLSIQPDIPTNIQTSKEEFSLSSPAHTPIYPKRNALNNVPVENNVPIEKSGKVGEIDPSKILISYAKEVDKNYNYRLHSKTQGAGYSAYFLELISQSWHPEKVFPPLWRHWLTLIVPMRRTKDSALLTLTKGLSSIERPMSEIPLSLISTAVSTNSIVAILEGFPIDPIGFYETPSKRIELKDTEIFAWSLRQYYDTNDPSWVIILPMVKSVVSAMNAVQEFILKELQSEIPVKDFVICGDIPFFTPWLIPAVDERVIGVIGLNNFVYNIDYLIKAFLINQIPFPPLFEELDNEGLLQHFETKEGEKLLSIIDPYNYRQFMRIPKLVVSYSGRSDTNFSFYAESVLPDIPEPIFWSLFPQASISREPIYLSQSTMNMSYSKSPMPPKIYNFRDTIFIFYQRIISKRELPLFSWNITEDGKCSLKVSEEIVEARVWYCIQDTKKQLFDSVSEWQMATMLEISEDTYEVNLNLPDDRYKAVFIEVIYPSLSGTNFPMTSYIHIIPPKK